MHEQGHVVLGTEGNVGQGDAFARGVPGAVTIMKIAQEPGATKHRRKDR